MMILYSDNAVGLLSSHSLLRMLAHSKQPEEFIKIWTENRGLLAERWDKLYEIEFESESANKNEEILDFEVIDSQVDQEEGLFIITDVLFTNNY